MITKTTFSTNLDIQIDEMLLFLQTYAVGYFDSIEKTSENKIVCTINLANDKTSTLTFDYYSHYPDFANVIYATNGGGTSGTSTFTWDTYAQVKIRAGYATSKGFCIQIGDGSAYGNFSWVFCSKSSANENVYLFIPQYRYPNLTPNFINMNNPNSYNTTPAMNTNNLGNWTTSAAQTAIVPMVMRNEIDYMHNIWRVAYHSLGTRSGKMTLNGVEFITNGYIALQDTDGFDEYQNE